MAKKIITDVKMVKKLLGKAKTDRILKTEQKKFKSDVKKVIRR